MAPLLARRTLLASMLGQSPTPIEIGSRRELFVDDYLVERFTGGARLRLHEPQRREIAVLHDAPWEGNGCGYHTVFRDGDVYRMYYHAWQIQLDGGAGSPIRVGYYESSDGIHWTRPELGIYDYRGSKKNNLLLEIHDDFAPFRDENPAAKPEARYKAVGMGKSPKGLLAWQSADAIHWTLMSPNPIITDGAFDTQNLAFWDPTLKKYRAYIRDFDHGRRDIKTSVSDDFLRWSKPEWLEYPGSPPEALYTNQVKPYYRAPHILIGFPSRYTDRGWQRSTDLLPEVEYRRQRANVSPRYGSVVTDALFMSSRDGKRFKRWDEAFLRPGLRTRHNWSYGDNYIAWHVVETQPMDDDQPAELSLYATESYFTGHDTRLRRYTLRIDGFASAFAPIGGGEVVTKPLAVKGAGLNLNVSTAGGGSVRVELQYAAGRPIPGFTLEECHLIFGDSLDREARWRGDRPLPAGPLRLRFELKDADLYSFRFR